MRSIGIWNVTVDITGGLLSNLIRFACDFCSYSCILLGINISIFGITELYILGSGSNQIRPPLFNIARPRQISSVCSDYCVYPWSIHVLTIGRKSSTNNVCVLCFIPEILIFILLTPYSFDILIEVMIMFHFRISAYCINQLII